MYVPPQYSVDDPSELRRFVEGASFGLLVSPGDGTPQASHLPLLYHENETGEGDELRGRMARDNPQWREAEGRQVLAVFSGPHAYISPSWYAAENVVPTWNYIAVHVQGVLRLITRPEEVAETLSRTVDYFEQSRDQPWTYDASSEFYRRIAEQIIAFRIEIDDMQGAWKLNQHHPGERRQRVAEALMKSDSPEDQAIGRLMDRTV